MKAIVLEGPTAVGKSAIALELAERLGTEIISADSRQVYRGMDIGTAKPTVAEQTRVRHHLIDLIDPDQTYSAGQFARDAEDCITKLSAANKIPLIVGGTGFYVRALLNGLFHIPAVPDEIREHLRHIAQESPGELHPRLAAVDPEAATRLHPNDTHRILRALEVFEATGIPMTEHWRRQSIQGVMPVLRILCTMERTTLYRRIEARCETMLCNGLLDEIECLQKKGYRLESPGMKTVGYREYWPPSDSREELLRCLELTRQHTRNFAKRQMTWYRSCEFDLTIPLDAANISEVLRVIMEQYEKRI